MVDRYQFTVTVVYTAAYRLSSTCRQARSREMNLTPQSPRVSAVSAALADARGEVRTNTGDQTGREGGQKTSRSRINFELEIRTHVNLKEMRSFFGKHIYRLLKNTLNGKRPRLVHGPRAGPTPRGGRKVMVRCHAWDLVRRTIYRSAGFYRESEALVRVLLWVGFYRGLLKLPSNLVWVLGHQFQKR